MAKLLLVSYYFSPIQTSESVMATNSAKFLSRFGHNITVLCATSSGKDSPNYSLATEEIIVRRAYTLGIGPLSILSGFRILPDDKVGWIPFALPRGKEIIKQEKVDVIISRSQPPTSHLVALRLKQSTGLPWIASFSDPWTQSPYVSYPGTLVRRFNEYLEKRIMFSADRIIFTTEQTKTLTLKRWETLDPDKMIVIPNSYDPSEYIGEKIEEHQFTITYTGSFYNIRSPEPFFRALKLLNGEENIEGKIKVKLIGSIGRFKQLIPEYGLGNIIQVINTIPHKDALAHLYGSDVLLLVDAPARQPSVFLPSKLVEYLPIGKPILAITPEGASADLVGSTRTGIVVSPDDIEGIKNAIKEYYGSYLNSNLKIVADWDEIRKYSAERCAEALSKIIEDLKR